MLAEVLPESLSRDKSPWVVQYRAAEPEPEAPAWPITKPRWQQSPPESSLSDSLMDDYARCVANCQMDTLAQVYFLGQVGHESAGLKYPMEIHDGSNYEGRSDLGNTSRAMVKFAGTGLQ